MAVTGNESTKKTVVDRTVWTGLADCKIVAINPTLKEMNDMGMSTTQEPTYVGENKNGKKQTRIDFWVETTNEEKVRGKLAFWVSDELRMSKDDKPQWINKYGKTAWYFEGDTPNPYFLQDDVRQAYTGEDDLHEMMQKYLNVEYNTTDKKYDSCLLDTPQDIAAGNTTELRNIFLDMFKGNTVRLLFGARVTDDGNVYQQIYNKHFEKTCTNPNYKKWDEAANGTETSTYGIFTGDFQDDFANFKAYVPSTNAPTADAETTTETAEKDVF